MKENPGFPLKSVAGTTVIFRVAGTTAILRVAGTTAILLFATSPAWAEWVKVGRTDTAVHYVDPATVRMDGDLRRVWAMQDMVEASAEGVRSIRALQEYGCAERRFRYLSIAAHSGPMARGEILAMHQLRDTWSSGPAGRKSTAIEKMVCGR